MAPPLTLTTSSVMPRSLHRREADGGERLVELEQVEIGDLHAGGVERTVDRARRLRQQRRVGTRDHAEAHELGDRRDAERLGLGRRHDHDRRGAVGDLRRVAGGDGAVLGERGAQSAERLRGRARSHAFVGVDQDRVALALRDLDRRDLLGESAFLHRGGGALVALGRDVVLHVARDAADLAGVALGAGAHVHGVERAPETVVDHRVEQLAVAHAVALARLLQEVGRLGHRLHAAGDDDLGVAGLDHLVGEVDRVDAREAHLVDRHRRHRHRDPALHRRLARRHLAGARLQHLTEEHVVDLVAADRRPARARRRWRDRRGRWPRTTTSAPESLPMGVRADETMTEPGMTTPEDWANSTWMVPSPAMTEISAIRAAIVGGAHGRGARRPPAARLSYRGAVVRADEQEMFAGVRVRGQGPPEVAPRRRGAVARAGTRRGAGRGDGVVDQLQHGVDVDLRAAPHLRVPPAARARERVGRPPRPAVPRGRERRRRRGAAGRFGGAGVEAGRRGHRALQPRRRPGPERARRLDARDQPAHLGLRDQLRRSR